MESKRQAKVSRLLQRELGVILQKNAQRLVNHAFITVTKVNVSIDLSHAKVYVSFMNHENPQPLAAKLNEHVGEVKLALGRVLKNEMRKLPDLAFFYDDRLDYADRIDDILNEIKKKDQDKG